MATGAGCVWGASVLVVTALIARASTRPAAHLATPAPRAVRRPVDLIGVIAHAAWRPRDACQWRWLGNLSGIRRCLFSPQVACDGHSAGADSASTPM